MTDAASAGQQAGADGAAAAAAAGAAQNGGEGAAQGGQQAAQNGQAVGAQNAGTGSQVQDWRSGLDGEHAEFAARLSSPQDAVKVALDLRKANSSMVRVPQQGATAEEVAKFHKAIGVPEKADGYQWDLGREPTEADQAVLGAVSEVFHKNGVPASAAKAVSKAVADLAAAQLAEEERVAIQHRETAEAKLKQEWGGDSDRNWQVAKRAVEVFGGPELKSFLNDTMVNGAKLGDHPMMAKVFAKIGLRMGEGEFIGAVTESDRQTTSERLEQILAENPPGSEGYKRASVQREIKALNARLHGTGPSVGFGAAR